MAHNKKLSSLQSRREDVKNGSRGGKLGKTPQRGAVFPMWWQRTLCHRMRIQDARLASQREIRKIFVPEVWRVWA